MKRIIGISREDLARMRDAAEAEIPGPGFPTAFWVEARATLQRRGIEGHPLEVTVRDSWRGSIYELIYDDGVRDDGVRDD
jgi:hypothetical protein